MGVIGNNLPHRKIEWDGESSGVCGHRSELTHLGSSEENLLPDNDLGGVNFSPLSKLLMYRPLYAGLF